MTTNYTRVEPHPNDAYLKHINISRDILYITSGDSIEKILILI